MKQFNQQNGFTLVEVLIAVLVMAIGLLGLAGLQLTALQQNTSASNRSIATMKAYEIADKMLANSGQLNSYVVGLGAPPNSGTCIGGGANCSRTAMADFDLAEWKCSLGNWNDDATCTGLGIEGPLAAGDGMIVANGNNFFTVTIMWDDEKTGATGTTCPDNPNPNNDLTCFTMQFKPAN